MAGEEPVGGLVDAVAAFTAEVVKAVTGPGGVKVVQPLRLRHRWAYLLLAIDSRAATLRWRWLDHRRGGPIKDALDVLPAV